MKKNFALIVVLLVVSVLFIACGVEKANESAATAKPQEDSKHAEQDSATKVGVQTMEVAGDNPANGGVIKISLNASPKNLDPKNRTSGYETNVMKQVYDTLVVYSNDNKEMMPSLAKKWEISDDGLAYTFYLRDDVYFQKGKYQEGRQLVAEDIKYSLERATQAKNVDLLELDHVEVIDELTAKCVLKYPSAIFLDALSAGTQLIVCKEEVEGWGDEYTYHIIGTGPFKLKKFVLDQYVEIERNDAYWGPRPYLDGAIFYTITESNQLVNGLKSGSLDVVPSISGEGVTLIKEDANLELVLEPNTSVSFVGFNLDSEKLKDKRIRQALIEAVDMKDLVAGVYPNGEANFAGQPMPKASWGYTEALEKYVPKYDPEHAKALMKEAGFGDGMKMTANFSSSDVTKKLATAIQAYWKQNLNVDLEIISTNWATFAETVTTGQHDMYGVTIPVTPDPYYYTGMIMSSGAIGTMRNGVRFNDPILDNMIKESLKLIKKEDRVAKTEEIIAYAMDIYPALYWAHANLVWGVNKKVQGLVPKNEYYLCNEYTNVWLKE